MHQTEKERLEAHMDFLWGQLSLARERGNWQRYWTLRRSWLAFGRLYSLVCQQQADEARAQLTLLPNETGRRHDQPPAA